MNRWVGGLEFHRCSGKEWELNKYRAKESYFSIEKCFGKDNFNSEKK